jgi:hypothetical protein
MLSAHRHSTQASIRTHPVRDIHVLAMVDDKPVKEFPVIR